MQRPAEPELLEALDLVRDETERSAERLALEEDVDAEARDTGDRMREVELAALLEALLLLARENAIEKVARVLRARARGRQEARRPSRAGRTRSVAPSA
jgi:hypothetical protein